MLNVLSPAVLPKPSTRFHTFLQLAVGNINASFCSWCEYICKCKPPTISAVDPDQIPEIPSASRSQLSPLYIPPSVSADWLDTTDLDPHEILTSLCRYFRGTIYRGNRSIANRCSRKGPERLHGVSGYSDLAETRWEPTQVADRYSMGRQRNVELKPLLKIAFKKKL